MTRPQNKSTSVSRGVSEERLETWRRRAGEAGGKGLDEGEEGMCQTTSAKEERRWLRMQTGESFPKQHLDRVQHLPEEGEMGGRRRPG